MRLFMLVALLGLAPFACSNSSSPSYGSPQDCTAAGGQCVVGPSAGICAKEGPSNTCNCNPGCNPSGSYCCVTFIDAGAGSDGGALTACAASTNNNVACNHADASDCLICQQGAGIYCSCLASDGGSAWQCVGTEHACQ